MYQKQSRINKSNINNERQNWDNMNDQHINTPLSFSDLNSINNNNNNNNNNTNSINNNNNNNYNTNSINNNTLPINSIGKLSKKKSSTIHNSNKSNNNLNNISSKASLTNINKQSLNSSNKNINYNKKTDQNTNKKTQIINKQIEQFQFVYKTFSNLFNASYLSFNQLIFGLKSISIQIDSQKKYYQIKTLFDQLKLQNQPHITIENSIKIAIKLLKQQKIKHNSNYTHLQKAYFHLLQQGNHIQIPTTTQINSLNQFKTYINSSNQYKPYSNNNQQIQKYLSQQSLKNIAEYLGMQNQLTPSIIQDIMQYVDTDGKSYLTFQDILTAIQSSQVLTL